MKRRGRPRKPGKRYRSGDLKPESPREIAARLPHRRGLVPEARCDQRAESELGRLVLRGLLEPVLGTAGEEFAVRYRGYIATLDAPRRPSGGHGRSFDCGGCLGMVGTRFCICEVRKAKWNVVATALMLCGVGSYREVIGVVIHDRPPWDLGLLRIGLNEVAVHLGLTARPKQIREISVSNSSPAV
jgi:hypothetical protein